MQAILIVGAGGFLGAIVRYLVSLWFKGQTSSQFPYATLAINLSGCFLIGIAMFFVERLTNRTLYLAGVVGFLGAFTTFSTFGLETLELLRNDHRTWAVLYAGISMVAGLALVWAGQLLSAFFIYSARS